MFPLVSTIQKVSKPLLEITNKDVARKNGSGQQDELRTTATKSKNTKKKAQIKSIGGFSSSASGENEATENVQTSLTSESSEQTDCDLNSTFIVEGKGSDSQHIDKGSKKRKVGSEHTGTNIEENVRSSVRSDEKIVVNKGSNNNEVEEINGSQEGVKSSVVNENKPEKSKRGRKRKPDSPLGDERQVEKTTIKHVSPETSDSVSRSCVPDVQKRSSVKPNSKKRKNDTSPVLEKSKQDLQDEYQNLSKASKSKRKKGNIEIKDESTNKATQNIENSISEDSSDESINELVENSDSRITQDKIISKSFNDSKKRKRPNKLSENNSNNNLDGSFDETDLNRSKRKKSVQSNETNTLGNTNSVDYKTMRGKKTKQGLMLESEHSELHEENEPIETSNNSSGFERRSRRSRSVPKSETDSSVASVTKNDPVVRSPSNQQNNSHKDLVDKINSSPESETGEKSTQMPIRSSTFILSDMAVGKNSLSIQKKHVKSIGSRIMQTSIVKQANEKLTKKNAGSTLKKAIPKVSTPGSVFKKRPANKMPDFKKIHQQLFNNMESLSENKKRQLDRAHGFLQSPIVPRCALLSPKPMKAGHPESSPLKKENNTKVKSPMVPSPLATKLKTPAARTPTASIKPVPGPSSVNRFGFRRPLKKEEATSIIGRKLPSIKTEKKKDQERNLLHGVRMNKRFMLQMQMRQNLKSNEKLTK